MAEKKKKAAVEQEAPSPEERRARLDELLRRARNAARAYSTYSQEQVDRIVEEAALAGADARIPLAELAVEETGMGVVEDKVI
ncbi:hypothetical protein LR090_06510, partial [Candidatus Bipolaricaulota bacterium]|nr:hypothetical protein [Candidatus Bipolaricaulota bacterium]